jgi:ABC-type cobalamin/Fe3+-siderophores transport system ATPase subunit
VVATHDLGLAARCDRVALLAGGAVRRLGTPGEVLTELELERTFEVPVRRLDDPTGGPPVLQVLATREAGWWPGPASTPELRSNHNHRRIS